MRTALDIKEIERLLQADRLDLPTQPKVDEIRVRPYVDSIGDDALRVTVVLANDMLSSQKKREKIDPIYWKIREALLDNNVTLFPYITFLTHKDIKEGHTF